MVTAFCECVAAGCKDLALSPPLTASDYNAVRLDAEELIERHGLISYHEKNEDLVSSERFEWIVITRDFEKVLSYRPEKAVNVKYDAYRVLFPLNTDGCEQDRT